MCSLSLCGVQRMGHGECMDFSCNGKTDEEKAGHIGKGKDIDGKRGKSEEGER